MKRLLFYLVLPPIFMFSCEEEIEDGCRTQAVISEDFDTAISDPFTIVSATVEGDFLSVEIATGGCDGESWCAELLVAPIIAQSYPPQVGLRVVLDDDELCEAAIQRTFTFDLKPLNEISDKMILHLDGWDTSLQYPEVNIQNITGEWNLININGGLAGIDNQFDEGDITWNFSDQEVIVANNSPNQDEFSSLASGTYSYSIDDSGFAGTKWLEVDGQSFGAIDQLSPDSLIVDMRASDGFQYIWLKLD